MNIVCFEKELCLSAALDLLADTCPVLVFGSPQRFREMQRTDWCLLDASFGVEALNEMQENARGTGTRILLVYDSRDQLEPFLGDPRFDVLSYISLDALRTDPAGILGPAADFRKTDVRQDLSGHSPFLPHGDDLRWELLHSILDASGAGTPHPKAWTRWVAAYLETERVVLYRNREDRFLPEAGHGFKDDGFAGNSFPRTSALVRRLSGGTFCVARPGVVSDIRAVGPALSGFLENLGMGAALWIDGGDERNAVCMFSARPTGQPFSWQQIRNVKYLLERFFLTPLSPADRDGEGHASLSGESVDVEGAPPHLPDPFPVLRDFANRTSNEFKNALVSIKTFTQLLPEKYKDANFRKDFFKVISGEVGRLEQLMDTIGFFAGECTPSLHSVEIVSLIRTAHHTVHKLFPRFKLRFSPSVSGMELICDEKLMQTVFQALFLNAAQAMDGSGTATVRIDSLKSPRINENITIQVMDSGEGIPDDVRDKVFRPFFSTRPGGLGLGLTCAQSIMKSHGGRVTLANRSQGGAAAALHFPGQNQLIQSYKIDAIMNVKN
jgi:hypothetical protein